MTNASERAVRIANEISALTATEHYRLVLDEKRVPVITDSKIGGQPYWPADKEYPTDHKGNKMMMVMQINCSEAGLQHPLPSHGMLQWFISVDAERMYGCKGNFDADREGAIIIYHDTIGKPAMLTDVPTHDTVEDMLTPVKREVAIEAVLETTSMGVNDGHFNELFFRIVKEITGSEHTNEEWYQYLDNEDCLYFEKNLGMKRPCHQMLGYPVYSQGEIRKDLGQHDTLLFQLDSQFSATGQGELVMWGDMGSGYVFVNQGDLATLDFSHPYYCWDCG